MLVVKDCPTFIDPRLVFFKYLMELGMTKFHREAYLKIFFLVLTK